MNKAAEAAAWIEVCALEQIVPQTGVCAQVDGEQVAVFRVGEALYAIDNVDPHSGAAVLSRGLVGSLGERVVVASPLHKQHYDLRTGECLEEPQHVLRTWQVARHGDRVAVRRSGA